MHDVGPKAVYFLNNTTISCYSEDRSPVRPPFGLWFKCQEFDSINHFRKCPRLCDRENTDVVAHLLLPARDLGDDASRAAQSVGRYAVDDMEDTGHSSCLAVS